MFRGPSFIVSTMQEETAPIFKRLWYDWTQQQPGIEHTNPLGQCWVPPIVAFYNQQGLLRTYSLPGSSIRIPVPDPHGRINNQQGLLRTYSLWGCCDTGVKLLSPVAPQYQTAVWSYQNNAWNDVDLGGEMV